MYENKVTAPEQIKPNLRKVKDHIIVLMISDYYK